MGLLSVLTGPTNQCEDLPPALSMLRHGLEHPDERFEFARVCLLRHYARNREFMDELRQCAGRHQEVLDIVAIQTASLQMTHIADYRLSWGLLSFLTRQPT